MRAPHRRRAALTSTLVAVIIGFVAHAALAAGPSQSGARIFILMVWDGLRPDFVKGRVNFGVALAKHRKIEEAIREFQAALQLNPTNESARRNLEMLQTMKARLPQAGP